MRQIRVVNLSGSPYDMGYTHGERFRDEIRLFTEERVRLCSSLEWTGRELPRDAVIALADACVAEHQVLCARAHGGTAVASPTLPV